MRSTAGTVTLFLVLGVLMASPVPHCKIHQQLNLTKHEFEQFYSNLTKVKHNNKHRHPLEIDESEPIDKKTQVAACGLHYMTLSLRKIHQHWKSLYSNEHLYHELRNLSARLNTVSSCIGPVLGQCSNHLEPDFPKYHFEGKQWIGSFMHSSVKFLQQLIREQPSWQ